MSYASLQGSTFIDVDAFAVSLDLYRAAVVDLSLETGKGYSAVGFWDVWIGSGKVSKP